MSARTAFASGASEAFGVPAAVLAAGYVGFGALAGDAGASIWITMVSTLVVWALPGQLVMLDMWQIGAPMIAVMLAVSLTNARFLPMVMTLMPVLREGGHPRWRYYLAAHWVAMTAWAVSMRRCPDLPAPERVYFLIGFGLVCMSSSVVACAVGYLISDSISPQIQLGLIFLTPIYFFVILIGDARSRLAVVALACGAIAGPLFHLIAPQWGVLLSGLAGGTVAYHISKYWDRNHG